MKMPVWASFHSNSGKLDVAGPEQNDDKTYNVLSNTLSTEISGDASRIYTSPVIDANNTVYTANEYGVYAVQYDYQSNVITTKWSYQFGFSFITSPFIAGDAYLVIAASFVSTRSFYIFDLQTGSIRHSFSVSSPYTGQLAFFYSTPLCTFNTNFDDSTLFLGTNIGFFSTSLAGSFKWSYSNASAFASPVFLTSDTSTKLIGCGSMDHRFYILNLNGTLHSHFLSNGPIFSSAALDAENNIYFATLNRTMYSLYPSGSLRWEYTLPFVEGTNVYRQSFMSSPSVGYDGYLYIGNNDGNVYSFTSEGSLRWAFATTARVDNTAIIDINGIIYIGTDRLYALNSNGTVAWKVDIHNDLNSNLILAGQLSSETENLILTPYCSPAIDVNGTVFIGSTDGNIYAIMSGTTTQGRPDSSLTDYLIGLICAAAVIFFFLVYFLTSYYYSSMKHRRYSGKIGEDMNGSDSLVPGRNRSVPMDEEEDEYSLQDLTRSRKKLTAFDTTNNSRKVLTHHNPLLKLKTSGSEGEKNVELRVSPMTPTFSRNPPVDGSWTPSSQQITPRFDLGKELIKIQWSDIKLRGLSLQDSVIGRGAYSYVVRGTWYYRSPVAAFKVSGDESDNADKSDKGDKAKGLKTSSSGSAPKSHNLKKSARNNTATNNKDKGEQTVVREFDVAIKILIKSPLDNIHVNATFLTRTDETKETASTSAAEVTSIPSPRQEEYDEIKLLTMEEANTMKEVENKIIYDCVVKTYGVAEGSAADIGKSVPDNPLLNSYSNRKLPPNKSTVPQMRLEDITGEIYGIVMRYERGGSLETFLYPSDSGKRNAITNTIVPMKEKLNLLVKISRSLSALHVNNIVHADIKPANILLSHHFPPDIRFIDFGLSSIRKQLSFGKAKAIGGAASTLEETRTMRGTPIYCAPELLVNPYDENFDEHVALPSRSSDMYAFGIVAWEILAHDKPFKNISSHVVLCGKVHQGFRPPVEALPLDTPPALVHMIEACWDKDRTRRKTAVECHAVISHVNSVFLEGKYDIFFSHPWTMKPFLSHVCHYLISKGYRVWYDQHEMGYNLIESMRKGIHNSSVVLACVSSTYQTRDNCMYELKQAKKPYTDPTTGETFPVKPIVTLCCEADIMTWALAELLELCDMPHALEETVDRSRPLETNALLPTDQFVDFSDLAVMDWSNTGVNEHPTGNMLKLLHQAIDDLLLPLIAQHCSPTLI